MRLVLLGAPGSGKGTQGKRLASRFRIPQISTGDLLRAAVEGRTPEGLKARESMDAGRLVDDAVVLAIIRRRLAEDDARRGFILDGFPRNLAQAQALDTLLSDIGAPLDAALYIRVDHDALVERIAGRLSCPRCGTIYNRFTQPPKIDELCDVCGTPLRHRSDDNSETVANRLRVYAQQTEPLIAYYAERGLLRTVDGDGEVPAVARAILAEIRALQAKETPTHPSPRRPGTRGGRSTGSRGSGHSRRR